VSHPGIAGWFLLYSSYKGIKTKETTGACAGRVPRVPEPPFSWEKCQFLNILKQ